LHEAKDSGSRNAKLARDLRGAKLGSLPVEGAQYLQSAL
jgi:hypothetical protein